MRVTLGKLPERAAVARLHGALDHEAPFLIEKLLKDRIIESAEEGRVLFDEVKKYIVLTRSDNLANWQMYSLRIDEVWHQYILFTEQYIDFCERFFGTYVGHSPSNAPGPKATEDPARVSTFKGFRRCYEEVFGGQLPDVWYDEKSITTRRRVFNDSAGKWTLRGESDVVDLVNAGTVLLSVTDIARDALAFVAQTGVFYVRELPGNLTDEEKIAFISTLVEYKLLRIGS